MRKTLILFFLISILWKSNAQVISGRIVDESNSPIKGALITSLPDSSYTVSDKNGSFEISGSLSLSIQHVSYVSRSVSVLPDQNFIRIQLEPAILELKDITVSSLSMASNLLTFEGNVQQLTRKEINKSYPVTPAFVINSQTGIYMQSGALNTNRITIRGIGARTPFGTNKIKAYFGEIPLTNGSGETILEDIDLSTMGRMEIIKGPNSSIYGSGLGGVIQIKPRSPDAIDNTQFAHFGVGSFNTVKSALGLSYSGNKNGIQVVLNRLTSDGYRENNQFERNSLFLNYTAFNDRNKFSVVGYLIDQEAEIPSSINETDFRENPEVAAFTWAAAKGGEDYISMFYGLQWDHYHNSVFYSKTSLFLNYRKNDEPRPFNILEENTLGTGLRYNLSAELGKLNLLAGSEIFIDANDWSTFENLYNQNPGNGSVRGSLLNDYTEQRFYISTFLKGNLNVTDRLKVSGGLNLNHTQYELEDKNNDTLNQSGSYQYELILSPRIGMNYLINERAALFGNISRGFSTPTLEETLNPEGLINSNIQPETGWMQEVGIRYQNRKISGSLILYNMDIENLLVARRTALDQFVGLNAGETNHRGIELEFQYRHEINNKIRLTPGFNYSLQDYSFNNFVEDDNDYSGNELTGVPGNQFNSELNFEIGDFNFLFDYRFVDEIPITDDNSVFADSYQLFNIQAGYTYTFNHWEIELSYWMRNILDEKYASMVLVNAVGFGNSLPRYYYPGLPRNQFVRLAIDYKFRN